MVATCQLDTEQAQVYAALCHVFSQGGAVRLLTYGLLSLSGESGQHFSHSHNDAMIMIITGSGKQEVKIELDAIGKEC